MNENGHNTEIFNAVVTLLKANIGIDLNADLSVYRAENFYVVNYIGENLLPELTSSQRNEFKREGEFSEYCETPEEAVEIFLKLKKAKYEN